MIEHNKYKIILTKSVRKLGKRGDVILVKKGFFRNYLCKNLAVMYNEQKYEEIKTSLKETFDDQHETIAKDQAIILNNQYLYFSRQASGTDILFSSVSVRDIVQNISEKFKIQINTKKYLKNLKHIININ